MFDEVEQEEIERSIADLRQAADRLTAANSADDLETARLWVVNTDERLARIQRAVESRRCKRAQAEFMADGQTGPE